MNPKKRQRGGCLKTVFFVIVIIALVITIAIFVLQKTNISKTVNRTVATTLTDTKFPEITIAEEEVVGKYYYSQLPESEQIAYKEVLQGLQKQEKDIYLHLDDTDKANTLFRFVLNDYPELFWCNGGASVTAYNNLTQSYLVLSPDYQYLGEELEVKKLEIEQSVNECITGISAEASAYDKIKYVYEYLVQRTDYNVDAPDNQNIYSVFVNRQSVCAGYAKATQYLLNRMDIFCMYVMGNAVTKADPQGQPHAWNLVQCDDEYYAVDTTWGDPVFSQENTAAAENINYDYLFCDDTQLSKTHTPDPAVVYPACTSMKYNYYILNGSYYETYDAQIIKGAMYASIDQKQRQTDFKFAGATAYQNAKEGILGTLVQEAANYLCEQYGLEQISYSYQEDDVLNKFVIYWNY